MFCPCAVDTIPLVNTPVRSAASSSVGTSSWRASRRSVSTGMEVSSLCNTSFCAAWRINSAIAGRIAAAASVTIAHCVAAGSGMPRLSSRLSNRFQGNPLPYKAARSCSPPSRRTSVPPRLRELHSISRYYKFLPGEQQQAFLDNLREKAS